MKKVILTAGLWVGMLFGAAAQTTPDSASYAKRKLKIDEINLVSSYYQQDGNNSAVTGGIGTEALKDYANSFDIKMSKYDIYDRQHNFTLDFNIDYYTSASSDNIDPRSISGASSRDIHIYPSISWSMKDNRTRITKGLSYAYSTEWDYKSHGFTGSFAIASKDNNREFSAKASAFIDRWTVILPIELRDATTTTGQRTPQNTKPRNSFNVALSLSQVINERLQLMAVVEPSYQEGLLSTPYHRVYFTDNTVTVEKLPGSRLKLPIGLRANYFLGDNIILRGFYRYYMDNWGMTAHTFNIEGTYKITPFFSISPYYRFNMQNGVDYFNTYGKHNPTSTYYTSDYDIATMYTNFFGSGLRIAPVNGILGIKSLSSLEIRYGRYTRSTGMTANIVTLHLKMK